MSNRKTASEEKMKEQLLEETLKGLQKIEDSEAALVKLRQEEAAAKHAAEQARLDREKAEKAIVDQVKNIDLIRRYAGIQPDTSDEKNNNVNDIVQDLFKRFDSPGTTDITDKISYIGNYKWLRTLIVNGIKSGNNGTIFYFEINSVRKAVNDKFDEIKQIEAETKKILGEEMTQFKKNQEEIKDKKRAAARERAKAKRNKKQDVPDGDQTLVS